MSVPAGAAPDAPLVVAVVGPESTGKTTLAASLARRFDTCWAPEHARAYVAARLAAGAPPGRPLGAEDVAPIARGQIAGEDAAAARAAGRPLVVRDTDLVSTVVYARHYYGSCPPWIVEAARARRAALYLLCAPDVPWTPDPARDRPEERAALHAGFVATLHSLECRVVPIAGPWADRERAAVAAVRALLASGGRPTS